MRRRCRRPTPPHATPSHLQGRVRAQAQRHVDAPCRPGDAGRGRSPGRGPAVQQQGGRRGAPCPRRPSSLESQGRWRVLLQGNKKDLCLALGAGWALDGVITAKEVDNGNIGRGVGTAKSAVQVGVRPHRRARPQRRGGARRSHAAPRRCQWSGPPLAARPQLGLAALLAWKGLEGRK